ncbi:MAG: pyruvate dehydrogenase (acetyl-transferring) E1 component subunit alpha [Chloroflexi bacterium]|nr:pyruvate dehydrogenase (acetyl-transferring) E1 component subunit alpha [Chloroflexota bacterium]
MILIREFEEKAAEMYTLGKIKGFTHLYTGQEAVAVGAISTLMDKDYVMSNYRDHGHAIAKGADPRRVMAELFGRATGLCKGKGGSMHLMDPEHRFLGGYAIVGGQLPLATGVALAISYREGDEVIVCFFGDGALNEGSFHESLNLAALWKLPVVFVLENNQYAMGTSVSKSSSIRELYKRSASYGIPGASTDGQDALAVKEATKKFVDRARAGEGPSLLEAITYRYRGHSMADPLYYRTKEEEQVWRARDPIVIFENRLKQEDLLSEEDIKTIERRVEQEVEESVRFADGSPEPPPSALYEDICVDSFCPAFVRGGE